MAGENSKKSGEIGETLASSLLEMIGWTPFMRNVSIECNTPAHVNGKGNPRQTHGEDQVYLYHTPFHDETTYVVHVSDKNTKKYPDSSKLLKDFKSHLLELFQTIECAKHNPKINEICSYFGTRRNTNHLGLLIWLHNDLEDIQKTILTQTKIARPNIANREPIYLIDNARATFVYNVVKSLMSKGGHYEFFYPQIGTVTTVYEPRTGKSLPLELLVSGVIPAVVKKDGVRELIIYTNEVYSPESYMNLLDYGLSFCVGLVDSIQIGMKNYNPSKDEESAQQVRFAYQDRPEKVTPFCVEDSILSLINGDR